jgi:hypothetical protein
MSNLYKMNMDGERDFYGINILIIIASILNLKSSTESSNLKLSNFTLCKYLNEHAITTAHRKKYKKYRYRKHLERKLLKLDEVRVKYIEVIDADLLKKYKFRLYKQYVIYFKHHKVCKVHQTSLCGYPWALEQHVRVNKNKINVKNLLKLNKCCSEGNVRTFYFTA